VRCCEENLLELLNCVRLNNMTQGAPRSQSAIALAGRFAPRKTAVAMTQAASCDPALVLFGEQRMEASLGTEPLKNLLQFCGWLQLASAKRFASRLFLHAG
jgi:hypothetical protein